MSEEKYEDKVLKALNLIVEQTKPQSKPTESSKEHVHTPKDVFDCPECGETYLKAAEVKLRPKIEGEIRQKHKNLKDPVLCKGCGEVVEREEEECPTCHGNSGSPL